MQYVILTKIYLVAKGFGMVYNNYYPFLDSLTSSNEETRKTIEECVDALIRKEFIIPKAGGTFSITHKGIKEIENLLEASSQNKSSTSDRKKIIASQINHSIDGSELTEILERFKN